MDRKFRFLCILLSFSLIITGCKHETYNKPDDKSFNVKYMKNVDEFVGINELRYSDCTLYAMGMLSECKNSKSTYIIDVSDKTIEKVGMAENNFSFTDVIFPFEDNIYIGCRDSDMTGHVILQSTTDGMILSDVMLPDNMMCKSIFTMKENKIAVLCTNIQKSLPDSAVFVYDTTLKTAEEIDIKSELGISDSEVPFKILDDGCNGFYIMTYEISQKYKQKFYRVSSEFEILYVIDDFEGLGGYYSGFCLDKQSNPVFLSYDKSVLKADQYDKNTGDVTDLYNIEDEVTEPEQIIENISVSGSMKSTVSDLLLICDGILYGYDFGDESSEMLYNLSDILDESQIVASYCKDSKLYISADTYSNGSRIVCGYDENGKKISEKILNAEYGEITSFTQDGETTYYVETVENINSVDYMIKKDGKILSSFNLADESGEFISVLSFDIDETDKFHFLMNYIDEENDFYIRHVVVDMSGEIVYDKVRDVYGMSSQMAVCTDYDFIVYDTEESFQIKKIDVNTGKEFPVNLSKEILSVDDLICGSGEYDFYFLSENILYGYSEKKHKSSMIVDWNNSNICVNPELICVASQDKLACRAYTSDFYEYLCIVEKIDSDKSQERTLLKAGVFNLTDTLKSKIEEYNNISDDVYVELVNYTDSYDKLKSDMLSGETPDFFVYDSENISEILKYKSVLSDFDEMIENSNELSSDDFVSNVVSACRTDGRLYCLMTDFEAEGLIYDKSEFSEQTGITVDKLKNYYDLKQSLMFFNNDYQSLMNVMIYPNLSVLCESDENVSFVNEQNFIWMIQFVKSQSDELNGLLEKSDYKLKTSAVNLDVFDYVNKCDFYGTAGYSGMPSFDKSQILIKSSNIISVYDKSLNKEKVQVLLKYLVKSDENTCYSDIKKGVFPVVKSDFLYLKQKAYSLYDKNTVDEVFTAALSDGIIYGDSDILSIADECLLPYFEGSQTSDKTVSELKNKINLHLKEIE